MNRPETTQSLQTCLKRARDLSRGLGLDETRTLQFAYCHMCLSVIWALEDGIDASGTLAIAKMLRPLLR